MDTNETTVVEEQYEEISLFDLAMIFVRQKKLIIATTILFGVIGLAYVLIFSDPPLYPSRLQAMVIAPYVIDKENVSVRTDNGVIEAIISSVAMRDAVDAKFHLMDRLKKKNPRAKRKDFNKQYGKRVGTKFDGQTINIYVNEESPKLAQDMATFIFYKTDEMLKKMGIIAVNTVNEASDIMLEKEIKEKIDEIEIGESRRSSAKVAQLLGMYSAIMARDEGYRLKNKQPLGLQLLSPASLADEHLPRGRAKTVVMFTMLGFFAGLVLAFMKYLWSKFDEEKKQTLKAALKLR